MKSPGLSCREESAQISVFQRDLFQSSSGPAGPVCLGLAYGRFPMGKTRSTRPRGGVWAVALLVAAFLALAVPGASADRWGYLGQGYGGGGGGTQPTPQPRQRWRTAVAPPTPAP